MSEVTMCDCSEEYGPCEQHADVLVVRQGAALHSGDELTLLLVEDLKDCGVRLSRYDTSEYDRLSAQLEKDRDKISGVAWFGSPDDGESAQDLAQRAEGQAHGLWVINNDGYTIVRPHNDCPLLETQ